MDPPEVEHESRWEPTDDGFRAFHAYTAKAVRDDETVAYLEATIGVDFRSEDPMTDDFFSIFKSINLPVLTWPYLRSFVSDIYGRMGLQPATLPAFISMPSKLEK